MNDYTSVWITKLREGLVQLNKILLLQDLDFSESCSY